MDQEVKSYGREEVGPKHDRGPSSIGTIKPMGKPLSDNRHELLRERNDLSTTVAQNVASAKQRHDPLPNTIQDQTSNRAMASQGVPNPFAHLQKQVTSLPPKTVPQIVHTLPVKTNRKRGVPHVYRDFSNVPDTAGYVRKKTGGVTQPFPEKLHEMLDRANDPSVVTWLPHGRAFLVKKPKEFTDHIMPKYFRQTKLTSFQRQLNLYGFRRITQGPDAGAYYHELFLRGRPQLCMRMQRQKVKGTGHKQPADAQTEPNFYAMPPSQVQNLEPSHSHPRPPEATASQVPPPYAELSPGLRGVHGAAHLLKTIAAGLPGSSMNTTFSLGGQAPTTVPVTTSPSKPSNQSMGSPVVYQLPSPDSNGHAMPSTSPMMDQSMSLLGRVTQAEPSPVKDTPSTFIWPPMRPSLPPISSPPDNAPSTSEVAAARQKETKLEQPQAPKEGLEPSSGCKENAPASSDDPQTRRSEIGEPSSPIKEAREVATQTQDLTGQNPTEKKEQVIKETGQTPKEDEGVKKIKVDPDAIKNKQMLPPPKSKEPLFSKATELIENKVMRGIETEEA